MAYAVASFGWDFARIGPFSMSFTDSGGPHTITEINSGKFSHVDMTSVMGSGNWDDLATRLQTEMNAVSSGYAVGFAGVAYGITRATAFTIDSVGLAAGRILGLTTLPTGSATLQVSQVRPWYLAAGEHGGISDVEPIHERASPTRIRYSGRNAFGITVPDPPLYQGFRFRLEAKTAVFKDYAAAEVPFTWQHGIEHARAALEPIALATDLETVIYRLTERGTQWNPDRVEQDWDGLFNVPFDCQRIGKV